MLYMCRLNQDYQDLKMNRISAHSEYCGPLGLGPIYKSGQLSYANCYANTQNVRFLPVHAA